VLDAGQNAGAAGGSIGEASERSFQVERLSDQESFARLTAEWEALDETLSPRTPFTSPLWNTLWWKTHRSDRATVRDNLFLHAIRDMRGALVAVAPMMATERPSFGPLRLRTLQCFGTDPNVTELRGLVCAPQDQVYALEALRRHLGDQRDDWDWVEWGMVRQENWSGSARAIAPGQASSDKDTSGYHLVLPPTWDEFRSSRSRNIKESIRKCYNSLKREGFTPELRVVQTPAECVEALNVFLRLHADRGSNSDMTFHPNVFEKEQDQAFLSEYVLSMARRDRLRIFQLHIAGEVVATRLGFLLGNELYLYYSGYDTRWAKFSVMTTLVVEAIKWAIVQRLGVVNLSTGTDVSKLRWSPIETSFRSIVQIAPRLRARLSHDAYRKVRNLAVHPTLGRLLALARR
jgi:CelD/BcsL family acetyltransferase involved in cellulose biosynthesis